MVALNAIFMINHPFAGTLLARRGTIAATASAAAVAISGTTDNGTVGYWNCLNALS
jgi:hypothetical protein